MRTLFLALAATVSGLAQTNDLVPANPSSAASSIPSPPPAFTAHDRFRWVVLTTVGPKNLAAGVFVAGFKTWRDNPEDYSTHWDGFAHRYADRLAAGGTSHLFEAGFGSLWGEDPRYFRAASGQQLSMRIGHVVKMAFVTHNRSGDPQLAYARYLAVPAGIVVSNTWEPDSPNTRGRLSAQVGLAFLSRIVSNAFTEFTPDIRQRFTHNRSAGGD
ncbi:MAG: hypothetical protein M3O20_13665 [Acidobacteriota bacterium]|nr:hypothetical protein [Acidobacteriota bacterium]